MKAHLTKQQEIFALEYLANGFNTVQAAKKAGYSHNTCYHQAHKLLKNKFIRTFLDERLSKIEEKLEITFDKKLKKLWHIVDKCAPDDAVEAKEMQATAATSAIAELNKMQGHYSAEKHINTNLNIDTDLNEISELVKLHEQEY